MRVFRKKIGLKFRVLTRQKYGGQGFRGGMVL